MRVMQSLLGILRGTRQGPRWIVVCFAVSLALLALSGTAQAQVLYGSLTGLVTDASGAIVPGATVQALNTGTGVARQATTNEQGLYLFSDLQPGVYSITISAKSFAKVVNEGVTILANKAVRVDATLQIGQITESVQVSVSAIVLQTERADVNTQVDQLQLNNLPLTSSSGRNFQALYKIVPGFGMVTEGISSDGGNPQRSMTGNVNGASMQANSTRIDGSSNAYIWLPFNSAYTPPTESIESVTIVTNSYDAEQGNTNGAAVSVVTKSGSNQFHGSAFEYHTDQALKATNRFQTVGTAKPWYIMNQYGGSIGGPIRRNRLFFFADWEGTKRRVLARRQVTAPNQAGIIDSGGNANLASGIVTPASGPVTGLVYDPNTGAADGSGRTQFPGNIIPAPRIDPAAKIMLGRITAANFLNSDGANATNNYLTNGSGGLDRNTIDSKVNYAASDNLNMFGRYSISMNNYSDPPTLGLAMGGASGGGQVGAAPSRIQNVGAGFTYTISSNMIIDANAGYTRQRLGATYAPDLDLGNYGRDTLHIPGTNGNNYLAQGSPAFLISGWNSLGNSDTGNPFLFRDNQYVANVNFGWQKGRHGLRFGFEHTRAGMNHFQPQGGSFGTPRGSFNFGGTVTALNAAGAASANKVNALAQFLLGLADRVGIVGQTSTPNALRWKTYAGYFRDSYQVTPKLTINFGVRWEYYPFATSDHGGARVFDTSTGNMLIGGHGSVPLDDGVNVGHGQFLPRLGIAYRLGESGKTVLRLGYGMAADSNNWRFLRNNWPFITNVDVNASKSYIPVASLTGEALAAYPGLPAGIPAPVLVDISSGSVPLPNNTGVGGATVPLNFRRGYTHSYNLTLQREFRSGFVAEAGYVGQRGIRMLTNENLNAGSVGGGNASRVFFPIFGKNWGDLNCLCPDANMYYDGLQTKATYRFGAGSQLGLNYTFSRSINWDDNEEAGGNYGGLITTGNLLWPYPAYRGRNKALAGFDRTHNLSFYGVYQLPFGAKQRWATSGIASKVAGGWQINWLLSRLSGPPLTLGGGGSSLNAPGNTQTPDQVGPLNIVGGVGPTQISGVSGIVCAASNLSCHYFDPSAFVPLASGVVRFGNTGRNIIRGPGFFNLDASLFRDFRLTERFKLQVRAEMFGATNTPHLAAPGLTSTDANTFGVVTGTLNLAGRGNGTGGERQTWFSAKLIF